MDEQGKGVVVVTGASAGLGRALCLELAGQEVRVAGIARSADALADLAGDMPKGAFLPVPADVGDPAAVTAAFDTIRRQMGPVTGLINNAAVYPHRDTLDETAESFMATCQINLGGMVACTHEALRDMVETGTGRIINLTSYAGIAPAPLASAYSVSKGAARIYTAALLADLGDRFPGIVINEWIPGALNTGMGIADGLDPADVARWGAKLVQMRDPAISGLTFERDRSVAPRVGVKRRLVNRVLRQQPKVVHLG